MNEKKGYCACVTLQHFFIEACNSKQQTLQASRAETLPTCHDPEGKLLFFNYKQGKVTI